mgnify:CR=1 FL=1
MLFRIKDDQRKARREGWMDNVAATIVGSRPVRKRSTALEVRICIVVMQYFRAGYHVIFQLSLVFYLST